MINRSDTEPGLKIAAQVSPEPTEEDLAFIKQMGVNHVVLWTSGDRASYEYYASRRDLFEKAGLRVYGFGNSDVHNQDAIVLNLPNRDEKIEEYKQHLRNLGRAGIPYTTYAHMANGIWSTEPEPTRGGAMMGKDVIETIHYFGERRKLFKVHFRNVNQPLPHFIETFLDNGYMDMYAVMRALRGVNFDGVLIPDHIPLMAKDPRAGTAFSIGYMKALVERANADLDYI